MLDVLVQWVPYTLSESTWDAEEDRDVRHLLSICDRFAPGISDLVVESFVLTPVAGLYSCSAGCHSGGSVNGSAGYNAAMRLLKDMEITSEQ